MAGHDGRTLIGYLGDGVAAEYAGQKVYLMPSGYYVLSSGKSIDRGVLETLVASGLIRSAASAASATVTSVSDLIPDRVDPGDRTGAVYAAAELPLARVDYHSKRECSGQLVYRSNLPTHFVTDCGLVLSEADMVAIHGEGHLLKPKINRTAAEKHRGSRTMDSLLTEAAVNVAKRQKTSKAILIVIVAIALAFGGLAVSKKLGGIGGRASTVMSGGSAETTKTGATPEGSSTATGTMSAVKGLGAAIGGRTREAIDRIRSSGGK